MKDILQKLLKNTVSMVLLLGGVLLVVFGFMGLLVLGPALGIVAAAGFAVGIGLIAGAFVWALYSWQRSQLAILVAREKRARREADQAFRAGDERVARYVDEKVEESVLAAQTEASKIAAELRQDFQRRSSVLQRENRTLTDSIRKSHSQQSAEAAAAELASMLRTARIADRLDSCGGLFTHDELRVLSTGVGQLDPWLAAWIYSTHKAVCLLPLKTKRHLYGFLRERGYWSLSTEILAEIVEETKNDRDRLALQLRRSELAVFRGQASPKIGPHGRGYNGLPGHVLHVVGKALPKTQSGYTLRTHYTALAQRETGLHVSVACQVGESGWLDEFQTDYVGDIAYYGLPGLARGKSPLADWLQNNVDQLTELVLRIRPSLLHAHSDFLNALTANAVGDHFGIPVVYESRGFWEESWISRTAQKYGISDWASVTRHLGMPDAYVLRQGMEEGARRSADHVTTLARVMQDHILDAGIEQDRVSIVPNAVSADEFPVLARDAGHAAELGIEPDEMVIGYISSIVEYEGIDVLIDSYAMLRDEYVGKLRLLIVGDGQVLPELKQRVEDNSVEGVIFTGRVAHEDILKYYSCIDLFVVPRKPADVCHLVTPLKPFEAFSSGRTVVMSDVLALREIALDSGAAELFEAANPRSLADVLLNLLHDEPRRQLLSARGAEWVRAERSWSANAAKYLEIFRELGLTTSVSIEEVADGMDGFDLGAMMRWIGDSSTSEYTKWFDTDTGTTAAEIKDLGWTLTGFPPVQLVLPFDWEQSCNSNRSWAFHLHAWEFMDPIMREYAVSGDVDDLMWCIRRALSWIDSYVDSDCSGSESMAWYDMSLGLRSPRLMALISLAVKANVEESTVRRLIAGALRHRYEHELDRSFNPRTNHGYYAAVGQTVLGKGLRPLPGMLQLEHQGNTRLSIMASTQFKEDGAHAEHSPDYHRMVLDSFKLGIQQGLITDEAVIGRMSKAASALGWMIKPDGRLVQFGDSPERVMTSGRLPLSSDDNTNFLMTTGTAGESNPETLAVFPQGGYAFVRDPQPKATDDHQSASYLAFSAAFHSRAHKHADDLNFVWSDLGEEVLVDAGRFGYGDLLPADSPKRLEGYYYGAPERQFVESSVAHNTVAVDGENHERRSRKPYGSGLRDCTASNGIYELNGESDQGHWHHWRRLTLSPSKWLVVEDEVVSMDGGLHDFRAWFNLSGDLTVEEFDSGDLCVRGASFVRPLWIQSWGKLELISPVLGQEEPMRGWRSLKDRSLEPTWSFGFALNQEKGGLITTTFSFGEEPLDADPRNDS